jgi:hypothetical protein
LTRKFFSSPRFYLVVLTPSLPNPNTPSLPNPNTHPPLIPINNPLSRPNLSQFQKLSLSKSKN